MRFSILIRSRRIRAAQFRAMGGADGRPIQKEDAAGAVGRFAIFGNQPLKNVVAAFCTKESGKDCRA